MGSGSCGGEKTAAAAVVSGARVAFSQIGAGSGAPDAPQADGGHRSFGVDPGPRSRDVETGALSQGSRSREAMDGRFGDEADQQGEWYSGLGLSQCAS